MRTPSRGTPWGNLAWLALRQVAAESHLSQGGVLATGDALIARLIQGANPPRADGDNTLRLTAAQATRFVQETEVVAQHENDLTGFSATLMRDRLTGQWHVALRGTEFLATNQGGDWDRDGLLGADGQLAAYGLALAQLDQMRRVFTGWSQRFSLADEQFQVTGYSLGGHLATAFAEIYPESVLEAVNFNGPTRGTWTDPDATLGFILEYYRTLLRQFAQPNPADPAAEREHPVAPSENVYAHVTQILAAMRTQVALGLQNIVTDTWRVASLPAYVRERLTVVHGHAQHDDTELISARGVAANVLPVLIEGQPSFTGMGGVIADFGGTGQTHSLTLLIDSLLVHDAIAQFAPGFGDASIEYLLMAASLRRAGSHWGPIQRVQVEGDTLERAIDAWRRLFLGDAIEPLPWSTGNTGYGNLYDRSRLHAAMEELLTLRTGAPVLEVSSLDVRAPTTLGPLTLLTMAEHSIAHRYALWSLSPFVVSGDDSLFALPGRAERLAALSSAYLQSRADFAYHFWRTASSAGDAPRDGLMFRYIDLGGRHDLYSNEDAARVVFGSIGGDVVQGSARDDRLFGDAGGDRLFGGAGRDLLEGGLGDDVLEGGAGADRLEGGAGFDLYRAGAGDVLVDEDGRGWVEFGGNWLGPGFASFEPDTWTSWDYNVEYRMGLGGLHVRRLSGTWSAFLGLSYEEIFIEGWRPGDLGIQLLDVPTPREIFGGHFDALAVNVEDGGRRLVIGAIPGDPAAREQLMLERPSLVREQHFVRPIDRLYFDAGSQVVSLYAHPGPALSVDTGAGHDFVVWRGGLASDLLLRTELGSGDDRLVGSSGTDLAQGGYGSDHLAGGRGNDALAGEGGPDLLDGGAGADRLSGGRGGDWILGGAGSDVLNGEDGDDHLYGDAVVGAFTFIDGKFRILTDLHFYRYDGRPPFPNGVPILSEVEARDRGADWLNGGDGMDHLFGGGGDDHLEGGDGDDLLAGEGGDDWLQGGAGSDHLLGDGQEQVQPYHETPLENLSAPAFNGGRARFYLRERGEGDDRPGNDRLEGGPGNDRLEGGLGDDTYVYRFGEGWDYIKDSGGRDRLLLEGSPGDWRLWPDFLITHRQDLLIVRHMPVVVPGWDLVRVGNWFGPDGMGRIEDVEFDDGTHWHAADLTNAFRERSWLELGVNLIYSPFGGYGRLEDLAALDATYHARGGPDFDVLDARSVNLLNEAGERLGIGRTTLDHLQREGMDLLLRVMARVPDDGPVLKPQGLHAAGEGTGSAPPIVAPQVWTFTLHLEDWFKPANRVEFIAFDDIIIGLPDAPPTVGAAVLTPYVEPGSLLEWQIPAGAFLDGPQDLITHGLRGVNGTVLPAWIDLDPVTATLRAAPGVGERGLFALELLATDLAGSTASRPFHLNIGMPVAPRFTDLPQPMTVGVNAGARMAWPWAVVDPNAGDVPVIRLLDDRGQPSGWASATVDGVRLRPGPADVGVHLLTIRVTDRDGLVAEAPWQVTVQPPVAESGGEAGADPGLGASSRGTAGPDRIIGTRGDDLLHGGPGDDWIDGAGGDDLLLVGPGDGIDTLILHPGSRHRLDYAPGAHPSRAELSMHDEETTAPLLRLRISDDFGLDLPGLFTRESRLIDAELHVLTRVVTDSLPVLELREADGRVSTLADLLLGIEPIETRFRPGWFTRPGTEAALSQAAAVRSGWQGPDDPGLRLLGGDADELLVGGRARDRLYGGGGSDRLEGHGGDDQLYGEEGDDHIAGGAGNDWLSGGAGNDLLVGGAGSDHYVRAPGGGHDVINDREGGNSLWLVDGLGVRGFSLQGQDVRLDFTDGGSATLPGGLDGRSVQEVLWADAPGAGSTRERSLHQILREHGWGDAVPRARADIFHLRFTEGTPAARIDLSRLFDAGDGDRLQHDLVLMEAPTRRPGWLRLDASSGQITGRPVEDDGGSWSWRVEARDPLGQVATTRIEAIVLDGTIRFGTAGADRLQVVPGRFSSLHGLAGDDHLMGGPLADVLAGGAGRDRLDAGAGDDLLYWSADRPAGPFDRILSPLGTTQPSLSLEGYWLSDDILIGGAGEDGLVATEGSDALRAHDAAGTLLIDGIEIFVLRGGDDLLNLAGWRTDIEAQGGGGNDTLISGSGNDRLSGGAGDDRLFSGAGNDELSFDGGNDLLHGGLGDDTYVVNGDGVLYVEDTGGMDRLHWWSGDQDASLAVERVGTDLHLWRDGGTRVEIAGWFRAGGPGRIEHIIGLTRRLEASTLDAWLADAGAATDEPGNAPWLLPDDLWLPHRWGMDPLPPALAGNP